MVLPSNSLPADQSWVARKIAELEQQVKELSSAVASTKAIQAQQQMVADKVATTAATQAITSVAGVGTVWSITRPVWATSALVIGTIDSALTFTSGRIDLRVADSATASVWWACGTRTQVITQNQTTGDWTSKPTRTSLLVGLTDLTDDLFFKMTNDSGEDLTLTGFAQIIWS